MNWTRLFWGGLAAGVLLNVIDFVVEGIFLAQRYQQSQSSGMFLQNPRLPFTPLWILGLLCIGWLIAWVYASVRPRLGPGPKTAVVVGLVLGLLMHVPYNFLMACWSPVGRFFPFVWMITGICEVILATLLAGRIYRERAPEDA
ncbi:MAG: hypothetical protein P8Z49_09880 [Acidobacteriota bacterium]|jgi:hypothetical protein